MAKSKKQKGKMFTLPDDSLIIEGEEDIIIIEPHQLVSIPTGTKKPIIKFLCGCIYDPISRIWIKRVCKKISKKEHLIEEEEYLPFKGSEKSKFKTVFTCGCYITKKGKEIFCFEHE